MTDKLTNKQADALMLIPEISFRRGYEFSPCPKNLLELDRCKLIRRFGIEPDPSRSLWSITNKGMNLLREYKNTGVTG